MRRRPRNSLTPEAIIEAAFVVSERSPEATPTFQALGAQLGAHPTAIYRHFRDKDDLMLGLVDALHAEVLEGLGPPQARWQDELLAIARAVHRVFQRHAAIAQYAAVRTARRTHEFRIADRLVAVMRSAGFSDSDAAHYYRVVADAILSYSANDAALVALPAEVREADLRSWQVEYRTLPAETYPNLAAIAEVMRPLDDSSNFELLVALLIEALERRTPAPPTESAGRI